MIMKGFLRLVLQHPTFDPYQFAYQANRSTDYVIAITALNHLEHRQSCVWKFFLNYNYYNLRQLWASVRHVIDNRPQSIKPSPHLSSSITFSTKTPQGCVITLLPQHECTQSYFYKTTFKHCGDTAVIGLIAGEDESANIINPTTWCSANNSLTSNSTLRNICCSHAIQIFIHSFIFW